MPATLRFHPDVRALPEADVLLLVGRTGRLASPEVRELLPDGLADGVWDQMVKHLDPGDWGRYAASWTGLKPKRVVAGALPDPCSRHNAPSRAWAIPGLVRAAGGNPLSIVLAPDEPAHAYAAALAVARALPLFSASSRPGTRRVDVAFLGASPDLARVREGADAVRIAARLVDTPPDALGPDALVATAREIASELPGVEAQVIRGDALRDAGLRLLHAVGRAATEPPALVVLDHAPPGATRHLAWVGKGIVYDTGGLALKTKDGMPGMKADMAGAAAVLAAFRAAVRLGCPHRITAVLCVAENAIGPGALRPDEIVVGCSGRSVEVNNPDAEGRMVLADGLAWVTKNRAPDEVIDLATLTGAQPLATGRRHAALVCNDDDLERRAVVAGRASGDTCHPLPFVPEFFRSEFASPFADMRNSVKDRKNAQSSCAAQFIHEHVGDWSGPWLHVDMVGPATASGRGTGYGTALLLTLADVGAT